MDVGPRALHNSGPTTASSVERRASNVLTPIPLMPHARAVLALTIALVRATCAPSASRPGSLRISISVPASVHADPITGRAYVLITTDSGDSAHEPHLVADDFTASIPLFATDVEALGPGSAAIISDTTLGHRRRRLQHLCGRLLRPGSRRRLHPVPPIRWPHDLGPHGSVGRPTLRYLRRAASSARCSAYTSIPMRIRVPDRRVASAASVAIPQDSNGSSTSRFSALLTKFWGQPMYLGATVLLPAGYDAHSRSRLSGDLRAGAFRSSATTRLRHPTGPGPPPFVFSPAYNLKPGYDLFRAWSGPAFPRMIAVSFQHPTPYFDDSYAVDSREQRPVRRRDHDGADSVHRIAFPNDHQAVRAGAHGRFDGGWESLALQLYHPDFSVGRGRFIPTRSISITTGLVNAYQDTNAFTRPRTASTLFRRSTVGFTPNDT